MPEFAYRVIDPQGRERTGHVQAASEPQAHAQLTARKFYVVDVHPARGGSGKALANTPGKVSARQSKSILGPRPLSAKDLTLFTRQLSSLVTVTPLEEALRTIAVQNEKAHVRTVLTNVHSGVLEGQRLAEAMRRETRSFPGLYRAMIAAGESSGTLSLITERLADLLERQAEMRGKLLSALAYPIILMLVAVGVVAALMIVVVPKVVEQFDNVNQQLPLVTRIVIGISDFLSNWWWLIAALLALAALALWRALKLPTFKYRFDRMLLGIPFLGRLIRDLHAARMARTLSTMVASRLPLLEGLKLTTDTVNNAVLRRASDAMVEHIRSGGSLSSALRNANVFPPMLVYLAASGEASGQVDMMLARAADYLEREFDNFTSAALSLLEPVIIVVMGAIVAVVILSILLPILQLQNLAGI